MIKAYDRTLSGYTYDYSTTKNRVIKIWNVADFQNIYRRNNTLHVNTVDMVSCIIPSYVETINIESFLASGNLQFVSGSGIKRIEDTAFKNCSNLKNISLSNTTYIGSQAFKDCISLTSVSFPNATHVGGAFIGCTGLQSISFSNLESFGGHIVENCSNLLSIYLNYPKLVTFTAALSGLPDNYKIYIPYRLYPNYIRAFGWNQISSHIEGIVLYEEKDISNLDMIFPEKVVADGNAPYMPIPYILDSYLNQLVNGTDFKCTYANNTGIGTATCTITGIGKFKGTVIKTFQIINFTGTKILVDTTIDNKFGIYSATKVASAAEINIEWGD